MPLNANDEQRLERIERGARISAKELAGDKVALHVWDFEYLLDLIKKQNQEHGSVADAVYEGPQPGMSAHDWQDWLCATLPFLDPVGPRDGTKN